MPSRYGRGIGLQIAGRGIQGLGAQLPGIIAGAREEEEDPLVRRKLELDVAAGEQKIAKGLREEETEKLKAAKAEALEKKKRMFVEILNDTDMKGWLAEVGKDPAKAKEVMGAAGISPAVSEGREEISMEGLAETEQKMAQPAPFKQQVAAVRQKMPGAEFEHAEEQPFKAFFGKEAEEKEQAGKIAAEEAKQEGRLIGEEEKQAGRLELEEVRQKNREKIQGMKNEAKKIVDKANPDKPDFKVANLEIKFTNQVKSDKRVKDFGVIDQQYSRLETVWDDYIAGIKDEKSMIGVDQALIMIFNKMLDPTSVVRESEFARTPQAEAVMERAKGYIPKLRRGGVGITDRDRKEIVDTAKLLHGAALEGYNQVIGTYENAFDEYSHLGVKAGRVVASFTIQKKGATEEEGKSFNSEEEAEAANLPVGTVIYIKGRKAVIE